jgi:hypothetical protein
VLKTWDEGSLVTQIKSTVFGTDLGAVTTVLSGKERRSKKRSLKGQGANSLLSFVPKKILSLGYLAYKIP